MGHEQIEGSRVLREFVACSMFRFVVYTYD